MWVRISFYKSETQKDKDIVQLMVKIIKEDVGDLLFYDPPCKISGVNKVTMTFYNLSVTDAEKVYNLILPEIGKQIKLVRKINSKTEEDLGPFLFVRPEFIEPREIHNRTKWEEDPVHCAHHMIKVQTKLIEKELNPYSRTPITDKAYIRYRILEYDKFDEFNIMEEPMYKERKPRRPSRRKVRARSLAKIKAPIKVEWKAPIKVERRAELQGSAQDPAADRSAEEAPPIPDSYRFAGKDTKSKPRKKTAGNDF